MRYQKCHNCLTNSDIIVNVVSTFPKHNSLPLGLVNVLCVLLKSSMTGKCTSSSSKELHGKAIQLTYLPLIYYINIVVVGTEWVSAVQLLRRRILSKIFEKCKLEFILTVCWEYDDDDDGDVDDIPIRQVLTSVTSKKSPNVHKSCPKMISREK